jgi:N6-adenosine-specific RNA methylase IME4
MRGELVLRAESGADPPPTRKAAPDWGSGRGDQTSVEEGKTSEDKNNLPSPNLQAPMRQAAAIRKEPPPLPGRGPYRVIVVDPPWPYEIQKDDPSATHPFPQMSIEQICAVKVNDIAHEDCLLWLRTTNHHMRKAFTVLDAWGFVQKTILTWAKDRMGTGDWLRGQTEHCLLAVRGKPIVELKNQTTLLRGPLRKNSQKPIEFYTFVEKLCPASRYAYLFSRYRHNEKWDCHGDEAPPAIREAGQ